MARSGRRPRPSRDPAPPPRQYRDPHDYARRTVLAGPQEPPDPDEPMTEDEALRILHGSCTRKHEYETWHHANNDACSVTRQEGTLTVAYQCAFSQYLGRRHWHVGHPPASSTMVRLALAMRWLAEHRT